MKEFQFQQTVLQSLHLAIKLRKNKRLMLQLKLLKEPLLLIWVQLEGFLVEQVLVWVESTSKDIHVVQWASHISLEEPG